MGGSQSGSQDSPGSKVIRDSWIPVPILTLFQAYGKDTLRPVTIKQVLDASQAHPDADFKLDGHEMTQVPPPQTLIFFISLY